MKKEYETPEMEILELSPEDIITASCINTDLCPNELPFVES